MRARAGASPPSTALALSRLVRLSARALETVGRARLDGRTGRATQLRQACEAVCALHGFERQVRGELPDGRCVMVANHVSYVDAIVLASLRACVPIAKAEVARWPVVGDGARALGAAFVRRGDAHSGARALMQALRALDAGVAVLGFPEGTTSRDPELLPFHRGLFGLARIAGVPIVPIAVAYEHADVAWVGDAWFLPHYLRTAMRPRTTVRVRVGRPLSPHAADSPADLAELARARIRELLRRP